MPAASRMGAAAAWCSSMAARASSSVCSANQASMTASSSSTWARRDWFVANRGSSRRSERSIAARMRSATDCEVPEIVTHRPSLVWNAPRGAESDGPRRGESH